MIPALAIARYAEALAIWAPLATDASFDPENTALAEKAANAELAVIAAEKALFEIEGVTQ